MSKIRVIRDGDDDGDDMFELQTDDTRSNNRASLRGNCLSVNTPCKLIAVVYWQHSSKYRLTLAEAEEYAYLFAAAPTMLDALKDMVSDKEALAEDEGITACQCMGIAPGDITQPEQCSYCRGRAAIALAKR